MLNQNSRLQLTIWIVIIQSFIVTFGGAAFASCKAPHYRKGVIWENSQAETIMQISIRLEDFKPLRLVCLAQALKEKYPDRKMMAISIFSSHNAAKYYRIHSGDIVGPTTNWAAQMHGTYLYDADKHLEYVEMLPLGAYSSFTTRIDLPAQNDFECRLEINRRCLVALEHIDYPGDLLKAHVSGIVSLTGMIARDGRLRSVKAIDADATPTNSKLGLMEAAVDNLKTWRFEPTDRESFIQIKYSYVIDDSVAAGETLGSEFHLPSEVVIRARVLH